AESDSSHYESYGEEDNDDDEGEEFMKDRAHYIQWSASQPCLKPTPESRLCGYLWRRKWLGQWSKELFIIRNDVLLCYKCARDLLPQLELSLRGCQLVYKSKSSKKIQHQLKLVLLGSETLVLGYSTFQQADEWKKGFLNVLMNCQWQSLLCQVEAGVLNMFGEEEELKKERSPQYTVQLRGCEVKPGPDTSYSYRITLSMLDDQVAVLE
uniref:Si:dkey-220o5.5 n=1 Tax=Amphilophus citrinellus TaxID=61819 RepID=A0A3Q0R8X0_AMPCI